MVFCHLPASPSSLLISSYPPALTLCALSPVLPPSDLAVFLKPQSLKGLIGDISGRINAISEENLTFLRRCLLTHRTAAS